MNFRSLLARPPIKWAPVAKKALLQEERRLQNEKRKQKVHRSYEYLDLESYQRMTQSGLIKLQSLERALRYLLDNSDLKLGRMQEQLVTQIIIAYLKKMFGDDLVANMKYLRRKFAIKELFDTLGILVPRRSGKTVACAIMTAVIVVSQPAANVVMYNLTASQAEEFIAEMMKYLNVFKDSAEFGWVEEKKDVRKMIRFRSLKYGTSNSVKAYACALKGDGKIDKTIIFSLRVIVYTQRERDTHIHFIYSFSGYCIVATV